MQVPSKTIRLVVNRKKVGEEFQMFSAVNDKRDILAEGDCDDGFLELAELLGDDWLAELKALKAQHSDEKSTVKADRTQAKEADATE